MWKKVSSEFRSVFGVNEEAYTGHMTSVKESVLEGTSKWSAKIAITGLWPARCAMTGHHRLCTPSVRRSDETCSARLRYISSYLIYIYDYVYHLCASMYSYYYCYYCYYFLICSHSSVTSSCVRSRRPPNVIYPPWYHILRSTTRHLVTLYICLTRVSYSVRSHYILYHVYLWSFI